MSVVGRWQIALALPVGTQEMTLVVNRADDGFSGRVESAMGNFDIKGTLDIDRLRWEMKARKPVPITVNFDVRAEGDTLHGMAKLGMFGKATVTGHRTHGDAPLASAPDDEIGPITADSVDPVYNAYRIDVDEWRDDPVRHRYMRGGFEGTDASFSIYFPPAERYGRRFFHNTYPLIANSDVGPFPIQFDVAVGDIGFTIDSGAYYLQTNLGGADRAPPADPAIAAYRVNAAAAKVSRILAAEMYGPHRPYGYLFGGSGGSFQVMGSAEMTDGVWDGFLPYVLGTPHAIPSMFTIRQHALRVLRRRDKLPGIADALEPGGTAEPYAGLDDEEAAALREATLLGFPLRGWWDHARMTSGYYANVAPITPMLDPTYVEDFWSEAGYLGTDPSSSIREGRFTFDTEVADVTQGFPNEVVLATVPNRDFADAHLVVLSGDHAGQSVPIASIDDRKLGFAMGANHKLIAALRPGDPVRIDNSWTLAMQTYHRHQVPPPDFYGWNQYRDESGAPIYPQRDVVIGLVGASNTAGCIPEGRISGKVLVIECLLDIDALAWQADWYRARVKAKLGRDFEDSFALWFIDNANHENPLTTEANAHIVSFSGALQQGLRDLTSWVETGRHPGNTAYEVADTQVLVPADAAARGGIQPTIAFAANGGARAEVTVGESVRFDATIRVPSGSGSVVAVEWDFDGDGHYTEQSTIDAPAEGMSVSTTHAYAHRGTCFAVVRVTANRDGDQSSPYARVQNLARARIVVT